MDRARLAVDYARRHGARFVDELCELIGFPSVSSDLRRKSDVERCAVWLADHLRRIGLADARVWRTSGHPLVWARRQGAAGAPTILIYGHYDVQPEGSREAWQTPPFRGTLRGDHLYGRGASDDKGQLFTHIKALESYLATSELPVNVVVLLDGEEEIGSPGLIKRMQQGSDALAADLIVISDTRIPSPERPALTYALRGNLQLELGVSGPARDVHAGYFGGSAPNPLQHLSRLVARLHAPDGRVAIDGFYRRVRAITPEARAYMAAVGPPDSAIVKTQGSPPARGDPGYSLYERTTARPGLTVTRVSTDGAGGPAAIPSRASARIDIRLVPDQQPAEIAELFRRWITGARDEGLRASVRLVAATPWVELPRRGAVPAAAATAYQNAFGVQPVFLRSGGSIGVVSAFQRLLGIPIVLMGFGLPSDGAHGPNEKFHLPTFIRGLETSIWFMRNIGAIGGQQPR